MNEEDLLLKRIMVCVTKQINCQRLIEYGKNYANSDDELFIIHVTHSDFNFLGKSKENEALVFLYEKAMEVGAELTVEKSDNVIDTLIEEVRTKEVNIVILGESGEAKGPLNFITRFKDRLGQNVELIEVPAN